MLSIIDGDLLEAKEQYICHACNCISNGAAGLAYDLFKKFSYSNIYVQRKSSSEPGTISIHGDGEQNRYIINMFSQYFPGKPNNANKKDNPKIRKNYFMSCLEHIAKIEGLQSIALPFGIGCGLAGGNWEEYYRLIEWFANSNPNINVIIYKK
jgi:O-acetyl-ADP-ribose deacetylase (regulator of RNase III)